MYINPPNTAYGCPSGGVIVIIIMIMAVIPVAPYLTDKGEYTAFARSIIMYT